MEAEQGTFSSRFSVFISLCTFAFLLFPKPHPKIEQSVLSDRVSRFRWKVENALSRDRLLSNEFVLGECRWRLRLSRYATYINMSLDKLNPENLKWRYKIQAFIEDRNGKPVSTQESVLEDPNIMSQEIWSIVRVVLQRRRYDYLTYGTMTFIVDFTPTNRLEMEAVGEKEIKPFQLSINSEGGDSIEAHLFDFRRLLEDGALSDVTLKCGDHIILAHRNILSARSKVFAAMFRNDMAESRSGVVEVFGMDSQVLDQLIQFMYSCKLPDLSMYTATQLYGAADKYGVESLKTVCSAFMTKYLSEGNACGILLLADAHGDRDFKDRVVSFILKTKLFVKDDIWLKFCDDHPKLAVEVLNRFSKSFSEFL